MDEIGDILKQARIEKGYSLNDVQQITKIQKRYLSAIEEGNFDVLPGDFYTRAFIRQYADVVGVDGNELLKQHSEEVPQSQADLETSAPPASAGLNRSHDSKDSSWRSNLPKILIFILILAIFIALYYAWTQNSGDNESVIQESQDNNVQISSNEQVSQSSEATEEETTSEEETSAAEETGATVSVDEADGTNATFSIAISGDETVPLIVSADGGDAWISIEEDGSNVYQGTLADGDETVHDIAPDASEVSVRLGNTPASVVEIDGQVVEVPEENSSAITQTWTFQVSNE